MGTTFRSLVMRELCRLFEVNLDFAFVKHPQTIGSLVSTHASSNQYLGIYKNETKQDWHNYVDFSVFVHNTSYHFSIGCTPTLFFYGRQSITLDLRVKNKQLQHLETRYTLQSQSLQDKLNEDFSSSRDATTTAHIEYYGIQRHTTSCAISTMKKPMRSRYLSTSSVFYSARNSLM